MSEIVKELAPLFTPRSVAVIGATNNLTKWGFSTFSSLLSQYPGELYPVNRGAAEVRGVRAFARVSDIPGPVDLAVIVVPAEEVPAVMDDCVDKGVKAGVIISAGFAETGPEGRSLQERVLTIARRGGIRLVGPNCMGMWSARARMPAFMFPLPIMEGPLALVSQGGNVGGSLVIDAVQRGIGFQYYVSCGGTADLQIEDYLEFMGEDDEVKAIMVYIEGLSDGQRFVDKVRKVALKKPVVALKPGRTPAAVKAISSHSGALSGADLVYEAAFKKAGVIRTDTTIELLDVALGLISQPLPRGRNVVITTPGGSYGVMAADACASRGLNVIDLPEPALEAFNRMFPPRWSRGNPVDPAGDRNFITFFKAPEVLLSLPEVDALIFMGFGSFSGISAMLANAGGELERSFGRLRSSLPGFEGMARSFIQMIESGDPQQLKAVIKAGLKLLFGAVMSSEEEEIEEFVDLASAALTTDKMLKSSFYEGLTDLFEKMAAGRIEADQMARIVGLMEPMLDALIDQWIIRHQKPVLTTTFTEQSSRIGEGGHFPYPNAERAAAVLQKLCERREHLEQAEEE